MAKNVSFESIEPDFGSSFTIRKFDDSHQNSNPKWHSHPELELVYIREGSGKRHIGKKLEQYTDGDLILLGPNLPHFGFTERFASNKFEVVLHFRQDFLGKIFFKAIELVAIQRLIQASYNGLSYFGNVKDQVGEKLESMFYMTPFEKLIELIKILNLLANTREVINLNAQDMITPIKSMNTERLDTIFNHVRENFQEEITLEVVSSLVHMTVPSFCRFFKSHTSKTFIGFVQQYRITHACKLLVESELSVTDIAFESGFNNFSHFNKVFRKVTNKSPSDYRKEVLLNIARR